jgi:hypothetical protein
LSAILERPTRTPLVAATLVLGLVGAMLGWWAWKSGAYFGTVFYPGAIGLFVLLAGLLNLTPWFVDFGHRRPPLIALLSLAALTVWIGLSIFWSSTQDSAVLYAQHALLYLSLFGVGIWLAGLLGTRTMWALLTVGAVGAAVGIATTVTLATGTDLHTYLHVDATLRLPIGYRNADAAFFMICLWALLAFAVEAKAPIWVRGPAVGAATMLLELTVMAQSRGSVPATAVALLAFLVVTRRRLRATTFLALVVIPMLIALPTLLDVYQHGHLDAAMIPLLRDAARAIAFSSIGSALLATAYIGMAEPRLRPSDETVRRCSLAVGAFALIALVAAATVFFSHEGGPIHFVDARVSQFGENESANPGSQARFGTNVASHRSDFWRVALHEGLDHPLLGGGAGSFQLEYLKHRTGSETPKDPHNVELLMFGELGFPGFIFFAAFVLVAIVGAAATRRGGVEAAGFSAGVVAAGVYWLLHSSYDWFWNYPAVTGTAIFLLALGLGAGIVSHRPRRPPLALRAVLTGLLVVIALVAMPLYLSERYLDRGLNELDGDPEAALTDLHRSASLNPFAVEPLVYRGVAAARLGDRKTALRNWSEARERQPDNYAPYLYEGSLTAGSDPGFARRAATRAYELNPLEPEVRRLYRSLTMPMPHKRQPGS